MLNQARQSRYFGPPSSQGSIRGGTKNLLLDVSLFSVLYEISSQVEKSYRCPKFGGDAKQILEIRVERVRNN